MSRIKKKHPSKPKPPIKDDTLSITTGISLGYDPGVRTGAFCVVGRKREVLKSIPMKISRKLELVEAAAAATDELMTFHTRHHPDVIVIERPHARFNLATQFSLDFVVGFVSCVAYGLGIAIRIVPISQARARTKRPMPKEKGSIKDLHDAKSLALFGHMLLHGESNLVLEKKGK